MFCKWNQWPIYVPDETFTTFTTKCKFTHSFAHWYCTVNPTFTHYTCMCIVCACTQDIENCTYNTIKCTLFCKLSHWKVNCMFTCCFTQDVYGVGGDLSQTNKLVLSYLSYLGCGISLLGLILTLVTYFSFRYLVVPSLGF